MTPVTLTVDPKGYFLYWTDQNKVRRLHTEDGSHHVAVIHTSHLSTSLHLLPEVVRTEEVFLLDSVDAFDNPPPEHPGTRGLLFQHPQICLNG